MMDVKIRAAIESDLPAIVNIYNAAIPSRLATADLEPVTVDDRRAWFAEHSPDFRPLWVLEIKGEIAAWIALNSFYGGRAAYNPTAEVSIYIAPNYQRRGYGSLLVKHVIGECDRLKITTLLAFCFDHNSSSIRLFERFGFVQQGHLPEIAVLDGEKRGLSIMALKLN